MLHYLKFLFVQNLQGELNTTTTLLSSMEHHHQEKSLSI